MQGIFGFLIVALILGCVAWFVVSQIKQIIRIRKHKKADSIVKHIESVETDELNDNDKKGGVE